MLKQDMINFMNNNTYIGEANYDYRNGEVETYYIFQKAMPDTESLYPPMVYPGASDVEPLMRELKRRTCMKNTFLPGFVFAVKAEEMFRFCQNNEGKANIVMNTLMKTGDLNHKAYDTLLCHLRRDFEAKVKALHDTRD
jgi:hypothetical protein